MKKFVFSHWNFMRIFRLIIGIAILVQSVADRDVLFGLAGLLFSGMALFDIGCCSTGTCYSNPKVNLQTGIESKYDEVDKK